MVRTGIKRPVRWGDIKISTALKVSTGVEYRAKNREIKKVKLCQTINKTFSKYQHKTLILVLTNMKIYGKMKRKDV